MNPVSERLKEQRDHGTSVFPCGLYEVFEDTVWSGAKHHWHDEMEIIYFMKGDYKVNVNMESYFINQECFFFINSGDLHSIEPLSKSVESALCSIPAFSALSIMIWPRPGLSIPWSIGKFSFLICWSPLILHLRGLNKNIWKLSIIFTRLVFFLPRISRWSQRIWLPSFLYGQVC